ncbi:hypothetical protein J1605_009215 [Eschrichtius robustus]|uniref:Uncharacterized protein n=1 Tax=Eschrichtius robustus TaxID=9764 RepID=A0AB34GYG0_ESCRO|nr:hypothetical protein J1605_009215 [Eschrichtius robustus]
MRVVGAALGQLHADKRADGECGESDKSRALEDREGEAEGGELPGRGCSWWKTETLSASTWARQAPDGGGAGRGSRGDPSSRRTGTHAGISRRPSACLAVCFSPGTFGCFSKALSAAEER